MITNEREYRISRSEAAKFEEAVEAARSAPRTPGVHPEIIEAELQGLASQLNDLREEILQYENLRQGKQREFQATALDELPLVLIKARIAAGLSQKALAQRLSLKEQQVQRYEATRYASASFTRLLEVADALGVEVHQAVRLAEPGTWKALVGKLRPFGFSSAFLQRLLPDHIAGHLDDSPLYVRKAAAFIAPLFGWTEDALFADQPLSVDANALGNVRLKTSATPARTRLEGYTAYAYHLAVGSVFASRHLTPKPIPDAPETLRESIVEKYGDLTLGTVLQYCWNVGVVVLPPH